MDDAMVNYDNNNGIARPQSQHNVIDKQIPVVMQYWKVRGFTLPNTNIVPENR